jgi:hypothetical protein
MNNCKFDFISKIAQCLFLMVERFEFRWKMGNLVKS